MTDNRIIVDDGAVTWMTTVDELAAALVKHGYTVKVWSDWETLIEDPDGADDNAAYTEVCQDCTDLGGITENEQDSMDYFSFTPARDGCWTAPASFAAAMACSDAPVTCPMCAADDVPISDDELAAAEAAGTICGQCAEVVAENREAMQGALIAGGSALAKIGRCGEDNLPCGVCAECLEELACS